jgi:hypothetical protein
MRVNCAFVNVVGHERLRRVPSETFVNVGFRASQQH